MSDASLPAGEEPGRSFSPVLIAFLLITVAVMVVAAVLVIQSRNGDDGPEELLDIGWAIAEGENSAGVVHVRVSPAISGKNRLEIAIESAGGSWLSSVKDVEVALLPYRGSAEPIDVALELGSGDQKGSQEVDLSGSDAWEVRVTTQRDGATERLALVYVLAPDPNLHGNDAVALLDDDPAAAELYQRASQSVANWHRVTYEQQTSDGAGLAVVSYRAVNDGDDGSTPGFRYFTPDGLEAYVIGTTAWTRYPGEDWEVRQSNAMIPPSQWGGEYEGATGFQLGPISDSPNGPCRIVTFVVPERDRQAVAWYAWCIDEETGNLFRDSMTARAHYMITEFSNFDDDLVITPPADAPAGPEASPAAMNQPSSGSG